MSTVPTVPSFATNDSSLTNLQNLSKCAMFLTTADNTFAGLGTLPIWRQRRSTTQSISGSTWTSLVFDKNVYDTDNTYTSSGASCTVKTQGYYEVSLIVPLQTPGNSSYYSCRVQLTTGVNSNRGAGVVTNHGTTGSFTSATENVTAGFCQILPFCLYPQDVLVAQIFCGSAVSTAILNNTFSNQSGNCSPSFSGKWVRTGP